MSSKPDLAINDVISAAYRLHAEIVGAGDAVAGQFGLSAARWQVLGTIARGGAASVPDLARVIGNARQSVQRLVSEMLDEGLLITIENPRHRRSRLVEMSARGRQSYEAVMTSWAPHAASLGKKLPLATSRALARDLIVLARAFRELADQSGRAAEPSDGPSSSSPQVKHEP